MKNKIIELTGVDYGYAREKVLSDVNLEVARGEFLGIIGPNGSGKTTLLKVMLGLLNPQKGSIKLFGEPISKFKQWGKIGYVSQKPGSSILSFPITVEEVVGLNCNNPDHVNDALSQVGLLDKKKSLLRELSGGQQQRVFIAKALVSKPELLILDEPTVGVDPQAEEKFYDLLRTLNKKNNLTLVLISHDIDVVAKEVSEVACINQTIISKGPAGKVLNTTTMEKLYGRNLKLIVHHHI